MTSYFQNNFAFGSQTLADLTKGQTAETTFANGMAALDQVEWGGKGAGQYSFTGYVALGSQSVADYLGIVLYSSVWRGWRCRVYGAMAHERSGHGLAKNIKPCPFAIDDLCMK